MSGKHTPEPWKLSEANIKEHYSLNLGIRGDDYIICDFTDDGYSEGVQKANANRIVKCVNACKGMEDPAMEIADLRAQLDLAVKALEEVQKKMLFDVDEDGYPKSSLSELIKMWEMVQSILTQIKGGADDTK